MSHHQHLRAAAGVRHPRTAREAPVLQAAQHDAHVLAHRCCSRAIDGAGAGSAWRGAGCRPGGAQVVGVDVVKRGTSDCPIVTCARRKSHWDQRQRVQRRRRADLLVLMRRRHQLGTRSSGHRPRLGGAACATRSRSCIAATAAGLRWRALEAGSCGSGRSWRGTGASHVGQRGCRWMLEVLLGGSVVSSRSSGPSKALRKTPSASASGMQRSRQRETAARRSRRVSPLTAVDRGGSGRALHVGRLWWQCRAPGCRGGPWLIAASTASSGPRSGRRRAVLGHARGAVFGLGFCGRRSCPTAGAAGPAVPVRSGGAKAFSQPG